MIKDLSRSKRFSTHVLSLLVLSLILTACRPNLPTITQAPATATPSPIPATKTTEPTTTPILTPTQLPLTYWISPILPEDLKERFIPPEGFSEAEDPEKATLIIEAKEPGVSYLAEDAWIFTLTAPFFSLTDNVSFIEIVQSFNTNLGQEERPIPRLKTRAEDYPAVYQVIFDRPRAQSIVGVANTSDLLPESVLSQDTWIFLPFHLLEPFWKVISIDGSSPLDENFDPFRYPLTLQYGMRGTDPNLEIDPGILPQGNYHPDQLSSLIMTGVTAMARDTAYEMEIQGVLYPGTEIREVMSAADLTHISNEVSFYEGCKFPDPDYTGFIFCSNPEYIKLLDDLGADVIELTGNHNNDVRALYKVDSVPTTLDLYEDYGMQWYAGGTNLTNAQAPLKIEHNGNKLAFIGCNSYGPEMAWATDDSSGAAPCQDWAWLKAAIFNLKQEGYLPIVTLQYQEDYFQNATPTAIRDFRPLAEAGAVIVNGSQSHVGKAMEFYADAFVHYGLGNLFFDQPEFYITYDSFIQKHFFYQGRHISTQLLTITVEDTAKPRFMTPEEREKFLSDLFDLSQELRSTP